MGNEIGPERELIQIQEKFTTITELNSAHDKHCCKKGDPLKETQEEKLSNRATHEDEIMRTNR